MKYLPFIAALGLIVSCRIQAEDSSNPQCEAASISALENCLESLLTVEDRHLNAVYSAIIKMLDAGSVDPLAFFYDGKNSLAMAERAWLQFRETQCAAEEDIGTETSDPVEVDTSARCKLKMTQERIVYLEAMAASVKAVSNLCQKDADACQVQ